jgi:hypothetical protein
MTGQYQVPLDRTANTPVSEGVHAFIIKEGEEAEGQKGAYWKFTCSCLTPGEEGKDVFLFLSLTPAARWRFEIFLDAIAAPATGAATIEKFVGRKFRAQIKHEDYEGRPQPRMGEMWPMTAASGASKIAAANPAVKKVSATPAAAQAAPKPASKGLPADATNEEPIPDFT